MKLFCIFALLFGVIAMIDARDAKCLQPVDPGICRGQIPAYYFNSETGNCEKFFYGGCMGNNNRFTSKAECNAVCK
ncbi:kappaPI-actitoxin-Avd3c-like [Trichoplusia ni]|uniref:Kalikludin n=1 Tax=Trichoplusia ni TaxID=7111 RepID=A9XXB4_TRINI|nr:kappaPI-actitoxin-Avd3c-like [Trichoplusia ni]XP_026736898.1 kappaPI-actitoxin-Avd3c-like [Trichoplusia ni]XP_026742276.1 kappaPI-actitoxin-Avd3c-like [Trichoplusia ni]ABV68860.1 kalikludin [Trichoplusia ni]